LLFNKPRNNIEKPCPLPMGRSLETREYANQGKNISRKKKYSNEQVRAQLNKVL